MPWEFIPVERQVEVKFGETALAFYEAIGQQVDQSRDPPAIMLLLTVLGPFSTKLTVFVFKNRFYSQVNGCKCP